jgi:PIN domain
LINLFSNFPIIRELECMKQHEGLSKQPNKQAYLVFEWIEECIEKESLWIHMQSSTEALPVVPTPPITPTSLFGCDVGDMGSSFKSDRNAIYSPCSSFMEVVTPTSEDHVLECALLFKKIKRDAEVVLLSSSITLKIKAMAEV